MNDNSHRGAWNGIRFDNTKASNDTSILSYCEFEYSKATFDGTEGIYNERGGAISFYNFSDAIISNSIFSNNIAEYGGTIYFDYHSSPAILSNLFIDNLALQNGSTMYISYSYPKIMNNTIIDNEVLDETPFAESATIYTYLSKPEFTNNIIRENDAISVIHLEVRENKDYYTNNNNIAGYSGGIGNLDEDPLFVGEGDLPFSLSERSNCINAGTISIYGELIPELDLAGNHRISDSSIDMGAFEYNSVESGDEVMPEIKNLSFVYPNPFIVNNQRRNTINFSIMLDKPSTVEISIYDLRGRKIDKIESKFLDSGKNLINWDINNIVNKISSGIYFSRINYPGKTETSKIVIIK